MIYDVTIKRFYRIEAPSEEDAVIEAMRLEETEACEWPNEIDVRRRSASPQSDDHAKP